MLSATCTGARVYGHGKQQRLQVILENTEPGGQQISFGCSQGVCLLTAPSNHPSRGYILVTPHPHPFWPEHCFCCGHLLSTTGIHGT